MKKTEQASTKKPSSARQKKADQYNDPSHNYLRYWDGREYEHASEEIAIKRLLMDKHFNHAIDIGGGYGRLSVLLKEFADHVTLVEPSQQQLDIAKGFLKPYPDITYKLMQADHLEFEDESIDLVAMIRVMHHLPDPSAELAEIARVLTPDGYAVIEVANYAHFRNRIKHIIQGKKMPLLPVDIRSRKHRNAEEIAFVNHNPVTFMRQLALAGLRVERTLSVSNLRHPGLKKHVPLPVMLGVEKALQGLLAPAHFGPSLFFLVRKSR